MARTWGQIRFEIAKAHPGLDADLLDGYIRSAYDAILDERAWKGLEAEGLLSTVAKYATGTVALTNGSNAVTGTGTAFTAAMSGRRFRVAGRNDSYTFTHVTGTTATLDRGYEGDTGSDLAFEIFQGIYALPQAVKYVARMQDAHSARPLEQKDQTWLDTYAPNRGEIGTPRYWAPATDTPETGPFVVHRIELYPAPEFARGYPYDYQKAAVAFDGASTSNFPLLWVNDNAIVAKARSLIYIDEKDLQAGQAWDAHFQRAMSRMHLIESQRHAPKSIPMHPRFTSHYRERGLK